MAEFIIATKEDTILYPDTDGKPIAENTIQYAWITLIHGSLELLFAKRADVFVAADLFWYAVKGRPKSRVAPDVMIVFGRPKGDRYSYMQWKEDGIAPQVVFEILSPGNRAKEMRNKFKFYDRHGVEEYYLYDPATDTLDGWRRDEESESLIDIAKMDGWISPRLGIIFDVSSGRLVLRTPDGKPFEGLHEVNARADREASRADKEAKRADSAEMKLAEQQALTEKLAALLKAAGLSLPE